MVAITLALGPPSQRRSGDDGKVVPGEKLTTILSPMGCSDADNRWAVVVIDYSVPTFGYDATGHAFSQSIFMGSLGGRCQLTA